MRSPVSVPVLGRGPAGRACDRPAVGGADVDPLCGRW